MNKKELIVRYVLLTISLFLIAFGVSLITKSQLGSAPISALAFVLSIFTPLSMGFYMLLVNALLIVGQMLLLGKKGIKDFRNELILQIPVSIIFSAFVDVSLWMQNGIQPNSYVWSLVILLVGTFILAFGIAVEVIANVAMNSGEYIVQIATKKFNKEFGTLKIINDVTLVSLALIAALVLSGGKLEGIREGTLIVAFVTGFIVRAISPMLSPLRKFVNRLHKETTELNSLEVSTSEHPIITIARELGSGGNIVAEMLSTKLNIPYYDKEMIEMAANESGIPKANVREREQQVSNSLLYSMIQDYEAPVERSLSIDDKLFVAQCRVIKTIAAKGPCIIVGRLADYVLKDNYNLISVFLHADNEHKVERVMQRDKISKHEALRLVEKTNTERANHYWHYTDQHWNDADHYTLSINTSKIELKDVANIIAQMWKK